MRHRKVYGHAAGTRPSSTAALVKPCKSATPADAVRTTRCAIFALVAGVRCDGATRSTAASSADFMIATNSGLKLAGGTSIIAGSSLGCRLTGPCDRHESAKLIRGNVRVTLTQTAHNSRAESSRRDAKRLEPELAGLG